MVPARRLIMAVVALLWPCLVLTGPGAARAQDWPVRTVRLILGGSPGGTPDIVSRLLADHMSRSIGRPFIVENVTGAGGIAAAQMVARAAPDGHTLLFALNSQAVSNLFLYKLLPYDDPFKDFIPVAMIVDNAPFEIAVHPEVAARGVAELLTLAKAQPGKLSYAVTAANASTAIAGQWLNRIAGTDMVLVPYKITAQAIQDTVAGRTQIIIISPAVIESFVKAGKLRHLAVTSSRRLPGLDDVPTVMETVPGFEMGGWFALLAPAALPAQILQRLNRAAAEFLADPVVVQRLRLLGMAGSGAGTPQSITATMRAERDLWVKIVKEVGIEPQ